MSVKTLFFTLLGCSLSISTLGQSTNIRVKTATPSKNAQTAYLQILDPLTNTYSTIDSAYTKQGHYHFKLDDVQKSIASFTLEGQKNVFVLDKEDIEGFVNLDKAWENNFSSDKENKLLSQLLSNLANQTNTIQEYRARNGKLFEDAVQESNYAKIDSLQSNFTSTWNTYVSNLESTVDQQITKYPNSMASLFIIYQQLQAQNIEPQKAMNYYNSLSKQAKASPMGVAIDRIIQQKSTPSSSIETQTIEQLTVQLTNNQLWSAKDNTSELTLFHFWASWCDACQQRIETLKEFHQKNKDKSLNIISISVDLKDSELQDYIEKENYNWLHAKEIEKLVNTFYPTSIPTIYAVDKNSKIIEINHLEPEQMQVLQDHLDHKH
ncbi:thioredoxin family protein [Myroides sp. LJL115]